MRPPMGSSSTLETYHTRGKIIKIFLERKEVREGDMKKGRIIATQPFKIRVTLRLMRFGRQDGLESLPAKSIETDLT